MWTPPSEQNPLVATEPELLVMEEPTDRWIGVRTASGELVTVIEVLSPANPAFPCIQAPPASV